MGRLSLLGAGTQAAPGGANGLLTGLVGYWPLSEASGNRADSSGNGSTLVQTGSVTQAAGILTNAAVFNGSASNYLSCADNAFLSMGAGQEFTLTCWYYPTAAPTGSAYAQCAGKTSTTATLAGIEYTLGDNGGTSVLQSLVCNGASNSNASRISSLALNTWNFLVLQVRGATPTHAINCNNGAEATQSGQFAQDSTNAFIVGGQPAQSRMINGRVCEIGLWKSTLSSAQLTALYNGGAALPYSSFT